MKLINSIGPNPQAVRMFMAERGIEMPKEDIDIVKAGENRQGPHLQKNPAGQSPCLELDDGSYLSEITAICEYLDEKYPGQSLIGSTPEQRAETRMWVRRIDLNIMEPMANGFRFSEGLKMFQDRIRCMPQAADDLKATAADWVAKMDGFLAGKQFVCGNRMTLADILLFVWLNFFGGVGQKLDPNLKNVGAWFERMKARPSAAA